MFYVCHLRRILSSTPFTRATSAPDHYVLRAPPPRCAFYPSHLKVPLLVLDTRRPNDDVTSSACYPPLPINTSLALLSAAVQALSRRHAAFAVPSHRCPHCFASSLRSLFIRINFPCVCPSVNGVSHMPCITCSSTCTGFVPIRKFWLGAYCLMRPLPLPSDHAGYEREGNREMG